MFISNWFGNNPPAGLLIGSYTGSGVGLGNEGDAVNLFNVAGLLQASVLFGASPSGPTYPTFDNAAGLNNVTISQLSVVNTDGAFTAANSSTEIGSPGTITGPDVILPVTITSLKASQKSNGIQLEWTAYNEQNIVQYLVEKSLTVSGFSSIGTITAKANGSLFTNYEYFDNNLVSSAVYYRIKVFSKDGKVTYTNVNRVQPNTSKTSISVYPNPVQGSQLTVELNNLEKAVYVIQLFNQAGQQILSKQINHQGESATQVIPLLQPLPTGVYQLKIANDKHQYTQTVIAR